MFRRKTDQVYATLQQVQRRLTQQTADEGAEAPAFQRPRAAAGADPTRPLTVPTPSFSLPSAGLGSPPPAQPQVPSPGVAPSQRRHVLQLSGELATILFLLWLVTLVASFFVGQHFGKRGGAADPGIGYAAGPAGSRPARTDPPAEELPATAARTPGQGQVGGHILVLASVSRANPDDEQRFGNDARLLNQYAEKNVRSGYKPWFGVRKPTNGGLQLVFGVVNGKFGVDKDAFATLADGVDRAGYKGAHWIKIGDK